MKSKIDYSLYLVTHRNLMSVSSIEECVTKAIIGGCTVVQLREKQTSSKIFYQTALKVKQITSYYNVPLIINDRVDIALAVNANGVHIGQSDLPATVVRHIIGQDKIIGVSASNLSQAINAVDCGADYIGVGAMFATNTKTDADNTSINELIEIRKAVKLPIVGIGGINKKTIPNLYCIGIDGIAVVSAIISQPNITQAAKDIKKIFIDNK